DAVSDLDVSESLAILTDFVGSHSPREHVRLCHGLARYRYVVMDVQRFCSKRDSEAEQDQLIQELAKCGLSVKEEVADLGGMGRSLLLETNVAAEKRPSPGAAPRPAMRSGGGLAVVEADRPATSTEISVAVASTELEARSPQALVESETTGTVSPLR